MSTVLAIAGLAVLSVVFGILYRHKGCGSCRETEGSEGCEGCSAHGPDRQEREEREEIHVHR